MPIPPRPSSASILYRFMRMLPSIIGFLIYCVEELNVIQLEREQKLFAYRSSCTGWESLPVYGTVSFLNDNICTDNDTSLIQNLIIENDLSIRRAMCSPC